MVFFHSKGVLTLEIIEPYSSKVTEIMLLNCKLS